MDAATAPAMVAVVPVRHGQLPLGGLEAIAECGGTVMLAGSEPSADEVAGVAHAVELVELGPFQPVRWASALAPLLRQRGTVVLPGSPDGRDLAPHLAHRLGRRLLAGAMEVTVARATLIRAGGGSLLDTTITEPVVATLQPGVRGVATEPGSNDAAAAVSNVVPAPVAAPPDEPTLSVELAADAERIAAGGAGLDSPDRLDELARVASALGASMGATRVVTDRGWADHRRQIGTTGVVVDPRLYLAFAVSGAVQHTAGLGTPDHIISVNLDRYCPMMQMADLAVVADTNAVIHELHRLLCEQVGRTAFSGHARRTDD